MENKYLFCEERDGVLQKNVIFHLMFLAKNIGIC